MASCGGTKIVSDWQGKSENQFYKLEKTGEIIEGKRSYKRLILLKTGQTISYDMYGNEVSESSIKDDGYYQKGALRSYTRDDVKGVVTDNTTGLIWEDDDSYVAKHLQVWSGSKMYCQELRLGGYSNWRLPTVRELKTLVDRGRYDLAIDSAFQNVEDHYYWSSSTKTYQATEMYGTMVGVRAVDFKNGEDGWLDKSAHTAYVRCVRSADN